MASIPYTPTPAAIPRFLQHIQSAGVPPKVSTRYLVSVGFKSTNDRYLIGILKSIDFIDASGVPTQRWRGYRDKGEAPGVLAAAVRHAYPELFETYPDAYRKDDEAIRNFFGSRTDLGESTLSLAVRTFKTLCEKADFEGAQVANEVVDEIARLAEHASNQPKARIGSAARVGPVVNINIQLELPATEDASVYEKLFAAMRKNLFPDGNSS